MHVVTPNLATDKLTEKARYEIIDLKNRLFHHQDFSENNELKYIEDMSYIELKNLYIWLFNETFDDTYNISSTRDNLLNFFVNRWYTEEAKKKVLSYEVQDIEEMKLPSTNPSFRDTTIEDIINLCTYEIDWDVLNTNENPDLVKAANSLLKELYSVYGYQLWNNK